MNILRFALPAAAALVGFALAPKHAAAQQQTFCDKALVADSVYNTVTPIGQKSRIDYFLQLRNTTNKSVPASIQFTYSAPPAVISEPLRKSQTLTQYKSVLFKLGSQTVNNPGGQGGIGRETAAKAITIVCAVPR